jgi:hypothetical protein
MYVARWLLIGAVLMAAFLAWLWAGQQSLAGLAGAIALAVALVAAVHLPGTRYSEVLDSVWNLPRASGESERKYRFKVALAWLLVVATCVAGCIALRGLTSMADGALTIVGVGLRVFGFVAGLMAFQSLFAGLFRSSSGTSPERPT